MELDSTTMAAGMGGRQKVSYVLRCLFGLQSFVPHVHPGKPAGMAVPRCMIWSWTQLILSLRVRSATTVIGGIIVELNHSEPIPRSYVEDHAVSRLHILVCPPPQKVLSLRVC
jgi:hypothetical protein